MPALGRRIPQDWKHYEKYPLSLPSTEIPEEAEHLLTFYKAWRDYYDQNGYGACVGFSVSQAMSWLNRSRYDAFWLWDRAKEIDAWADTNPGDNNGTSVRAALKILKTVGHKKVWGSSVYQPDLAHGIEQFRWARTVDEIRAMLARGRPVVMGTNWYSNFNPTLKGRDYWLCDDESNLGSVDGGHAYMLDGVSDRRQAVRTPNSWGADWPRSWISYSLLERLINEYGEAGLVVDRPGP